MLHCPTIDEARRDIRKMLEEEPDPRMTPEKEEKAAQFLYDSWLGAVEECARSDERMAREEYASVAPRKEGP